MEATDRIVLAYAVAGPGRPLIVLDRETVIAEADALGLFIYGVGPDEA